MITTKKHYAKYENKDPRCDYPFTPDPIGYCWGFAQYIDYLKRPIAWKNGVKWYKLSCRGCESYKDKNP